MSVLELAAGDWTLVIRAEQDAISIVELRAPDRVVRIGADTEELILERLLVAALRAQRYSLEPRWVLSLADSAHALYVCDTDAARLLRIQDRDALWIATLTLTQEDEQRWRARTHERYAQLVPCERCATITVDRVDDLAVVGGSQDPYDDPGGELRVCPSCGRYFEYERDHDNAIGYEASEPRLTRLDTRRALRLIDDATTVAARQLAYFASQPGDYHARVAQQYRDELARLAQARERLRG